MLPFQARVDLGAMATKGCSAFPKAPASLEPHNHSLGGLTPLQRYCRCILQPQPTGQHSSRTTSRGTKTCFTVTHCKSHIARRANKYIYFRGFLRGVRQTKLCWWTSFTLKQRKRPGVRGALRRMKFGSY